jgi:PAS domain S-box-containing protein
MSGLIMKQDKRSHDDDRRSGHMYRNFLDAAAAMMWVSDSHGRVDFFNHSWLQFTGRTLNDEISHEWTGEDIFPEDNESCFEVYKAGFNSQQPFDHEYRLLRFDGQYRWVHEFVNPYYDRHEKLTGFVGTCVDITDRKEAILLADKELRKKNAELEQFAYVASHDLQEPLRKIQSFAELLTSRFSNDLPERAKDYLIRMNNAAFRMRRLINDLLTYSRVSTRCKPFTEVDLQQEITDVISDLEIRLKETKGEIKFDKLHNLEADPSQIRHLLLNIIGNGLKFHREDIPPIIEISSRIYNERNNSLYRRNIDMLELTISDNGIGFDTKYLDRIFEPFQRLHGVTEFDGSGIGLAVCKKIVERHGGTLNAQSVPGEGATFIILLPLKQD